MPRCKRCGDEFVRRRVGEERCQRCEHEVAFLIRRDAERRRPRFERSKDLTGAVL